MISFIFQPLNAKKDKGFSFSFSTNFLKDNNREKSQLAKIQSFSILISGN